MRKSDTCSCKRKWSTGVVRVSELQLSETDSCIGMFKNLVKVYHVYEELGDRTEK